MERASSCPYTYVKRLGRGAFGEVWLARCSRTGQLVALKKIFIKSPEDGVPDTVVREAQALQHVQHSHVVSLLDVLAMGQHVVLVQEYCCTDLQRVLQARHRRLPQRVIRALLTQLLQGVHACHEQGIMHRDLKPSNVLMTEEGVVKLADFGLARPLAPPGGRTAQYTHAVATRWYRAPELLYGARKYGPAVDVWAAGCIFGELLGLGPMFPGETDIDQLGRVIRFMGSINTVDWPEAEELPDWHKISFAPCEGVPLQQQLPDAPAQSIDLLQEMLRYNPARRITALQALHHPYLQGGDVAGVQELAVLVPESSLVGSAGCSTS